MQSRVTPEMSSIHDSRLAKPLTQSRNIVEDSNTYSAHSKIDGLQCICVQAGHSTHIRSKDTTLTEQNMAPRGSFDSLQRLHLQQSAKTNPLATCLPSLPLARACAKVFASNTNSGSSPLRNPDHLAVVKIMRPATWLPQRLSLPKMACRAGPLRQHPASYSYRCCLLC